MANAKRQIASSGGTDAGVPAFLKLQPRTLVHQAIDALVAGSLKA
ncbi:MAG: hypothetical protein U1F00_18815 [Rhodoferax sp.]